MEQSIENSDLDWEAQVVASHYRLQHTPVWSAHDPKAVSADWHTQHVLFHVTLLSACPSTRLIDIAAALRDANRIYLSWSSGVTLDSHHRDYEGEHAAIKDAALARDAPLASTLLRSHLNKTAHILIDHLHRVGKASRAEVNSLPGSLGHGDSHPSQVPTP